ncbi:hypothetical protein JAAARDRAFT_195393 [Jaapia argillacea MUCL 33604]|uniref:Uncharacterized protein n=1 Tax=Jaapia argillacea MUCL 33604 TaxID=933084 RepID=A0A067PN26_9AGAM|nr:hypothetical protein JAAARDRAFT_195393 [Jaapia argillacea MUCL 33604]
MPPIRELHYAFNDLEDRVVLNAFNSVSSTLNRDVAHALCETLRAVNIEYRDNLTEGDGYWSSRPW